MNIYIYRKIRITITSICNISNNNKKYCSFVTFFSLWALINCQNTNNTCEKYHQPKIFSCHSFNTLRKISSLKCLIRSWQKYQPFFLIILRMITIIVMLILILIRRHTHIYLYVHYTTLNVKYWFFLKKESRKGCRQLKCENW